jgi:hypothetical protein
MVRQTGLYITLAVFTTLHFLPATAEAQTSFSGTIAGLVKDTSGAVLPGVTVEAESPALIEKTRTAVTDSHGEYKIINLPSGVYAVTLTLGGFSTFRREGIELAGGVTADISAELRVGSVEETVTVTGQSPLVDVESTTQHRTVSRDLIEGLPVGRQVITYLTLVPGITISGQGAGTGAGADVGGSGGDKSFQASVHGSTGAETPHEFDGMRYGTIFGTAGGGNGPWVPNSAMTQEIVVETSGTSAEAEVSGVHHNIIPKQGANRFSGYFYANYTNASLQADNLDATLIARGAPKPDVLTKLWDTNPAFGGPIVRDRFWFYASYRYFGVDDQPSGAHFAEDPLSPIFTPDPTRTPENPSNTEQYNVRLTLQTSSTSKLQLYGDHLNRLQAGANALSSATAWEAAVRVYTKGTGLFQAVWTKTISNRFLVEAGETYRPDEYFYQRQQLIYDEGNPSGITDTGLGLTYRAPTTAEGARQWSRQENGRVTASYVTGSHNLKLGMQWLDGKRRLAYSTPNNSYYTFVSGVPSSVTLTTYPFDEYETVEPNIGIFAQDQWTHKRVTVNAGVRFDYLNMHIPPQLVPAAQYAPARSFAEIDNVPNWKDINPRLGMAYDLLGNGKTALKWNLGRYVEGEGAGFPQVINPVLANSTTTRSWKDANGNFFPDCDLTNPAKNGECGPNNNVNFGLPIVSAQYDPKAVDGWGVRGYNWETMAGIQHQLRSGLSVEASYHRRSYGNLRVNENVAVTAADYSPFCVTAPQDARLPGGGGQQICGLYNISQAAFSANNAIITLSRNLGQQSVIFDGVDFNVNARIPGGITVQGGTSTGRIKQNICGLVDGNPNVTISSPVGGLVAGLAPASPTYCDTRPPFQTQAKFVGILPLPWWGLSGSLAFQSAPGPQILATWAAPASSVTGLGRPLSGSVSTVSVPLVPAGTLYGDRLNQLDIRVAKTFKMRQYRIQPQADLYNIFNANPVLTENSTFGPNWRQPISMLLGRMFKLGVQLNF